MRLLIPAINLVAAFFQSVEHDAPSRNYAPVDIGKIWPVLCSHQFSTKRTMILTETKDTAVDLGQSWSVLASKLLRTINNSGTAKTTKISSVLWCASIAVRIVIDTRIDSEYGVAAKLL